MKKTLIYTLFCTVLLVFSCNRTDKEEEKNNVTTKSNEKQQANSSGYSFSGKETATSTRVEKTLKLHSNKLKQEKLTIDPDHNFVLLMAAHHEGAIQLSEELLAHIKDEGLKEITRTVVTAKEAERTQLETFGAEHIPVKGDTASTKSFMKPIDKLGQDLPVSADKNTDAAYAKFLLHHQQTGLELIDVELKLGRNPQVREMAQKIRTEQGKGIRLIGNWLKKQQG